MLRSKKFAHGVQIGKARVIELRVLLLRLPEVRHEQCPASGASACAQAVRRILDHGALRRRSAQLPRRLEENVRLRLRAADHVAGNDRSKILQQSDPFKPAAHDGRRRRRRDCNRDIPRAQLLQQPLRAFFCRSCSIGVKILQIGLLVLQDSDRIRAEFLPEPFDPRLVVESEAAQRAAETIAEFHLGEVERSRAKTLSGGWQRRLSIAMALISQPQLVFLDEPTLGLDVLARRELWQVIRSLRGRVTVILTTHYLEEAEALSDRIGILSHGRLRICGTAQELCAAAGETRFEEAFIKLAGEGVQ